MPPPAAPLVFLAALAVAWLATPAVRAAAVRLGLLDHPAPGLKRHAAPVPRPGGLAVVAGVTAALLLADRLDGPAASGLGPLLLAGGLVAALGLRDDLHGAGATLKLLVQGAAALLAVRAGWRVEALHLPGLGPVPLGPLGAPFSVLWLVGVSNAVNLVDGLDGLAAGLSALAAAALCFIASRHGAASAALLAAALAGGAAGFLPYNRHPASVFLGDSGALYLGFMLGAASLRGAATAQGAAALVGPALVLAVPLGDTAFALVRRLSAGRHPFRGDLSHLHHRLLDAGLGHGQAVRRLHLAAAGLAALGLWVALATATR